MRNLAKSKPFHLYDIGLMNRIHMTVPAGRWWVRGIAEHIWRVLRRAVWR